MSKILSQDEVNALIKDIHVDKDPEKANEKKNVNLYDFKHPDRISKDQLRVLKTIHTNFAKTFGTFLSTKLRSTVDLNVLSVDQLTYSEFTITMASPSCIYVIYSAVGDGSFVIEFAPELVFYIIDRLLGGRGEIIDEVREITIIEENVLKKIVQQAIIQLNDSWQQIASLEPRMASFETNPQFVQIAPASEPSVVISFSVKIQNFNSLITLCFPYFVLEPIMAQLSIQSWISNKQKELRPEDMKIMEDKVMNTTVEMCARLSTNSIKLGDIMSLSEGDVLVFDKSINDKFEILLAGKTKFYGKPGIVGKKVAVKITDIKKKPEVKAHGRK
ncbi:flagellar motor switch protein FliM [candidate division KSB1 bacterium]|nr:flagellar motor switch protein FliM [candidate division KSB1 bacterium]